MNHSHLYYQDGAIDEYNDAYKNLLESLTNAQASEVLNAVNDQHIIAKYGLNAENVSDFVLQIKVRISHFGLMFQCVVFIFFVSQGTLRFDCEEISAFNAAARKYLRRSISTFTVRLFSASCEGTYNSDS